MHLLATPFTFLEIAAFVIAVVAFLLTVRFFIVSQKKLEGLLPEKALKPALGIEIDRDGFLIPERRKAVAAKDRKADAETKQEMKELRDMVQLQQLELARALRQMESLKEGRASARYESDALPEAEEEPEERSVAGDDFLIEELRNRVAQRDAEIMSLRQEAEIHHGLQVHFDGVQAAYEALGDKVQAMEQQGWQAAELFLKVDSLQQALGEAEKTAHKKDERLRELTAENARLQEALAQTGDKLVHTSGQRQQLLKQVKLLEEMNSDMQQMGDTARKLKTEARRTAELESMLDLITEERDALLKRKRV